MNLSTPLSVVNFMVWTILSIFISPAGVRSWSVCGPHILQETEVGWPQATGNLMWYIKISLSSVFDDFSYVYR